MAVTVFLELTLRADKVADAPDEIRTILTDTRAFDGCVSVDVLEDVKDPAHLVIVEIWASKEQDAAYRAWRATPEGASNLGDLLAARPTLTMFETRADI